MLTASLGTRAEIQPYTEDQYQDSCVNCAQNKVEVPLNLLALSGPYALASVPLQWLSGTQRIQIPS